MLKLERARNLEGSLLVRAEPLEQAEQICRNMVARVRTSEGVLLLDTDPAWAGALNTVLVKKGVRVSELRYVGNAEDLG